MPIVRIVEALLYVFGLLGLVMGVITVAVAVASTGYVGESGTARGLGVLAVLYAGLPAFGFGLVSLGLGAIVTSVDNLRRDTILVASTSK